MWKTQVLSILPLSVVSLSKYYTEDDPALIRINKESLLVNINNYLDFPVFRFYFWIFLFLAHDGQICVNKGIFLTTKIVLVWGEGGKVFLVVEIKFLQFYPTLYYYVYYLQERTYLFFTRQCISEWAKKCCWVN